MNDIQRIKQKNIQKRNLKLTKLKKRTKKINRQNLLKKQKHDKFAISYFKKKKNYIENKIKNIETHYDSGIQKEKDKLKNWDAQYTSKHQSLLEKIFKKYNFKLKKLEKQNKERNLAKIKLIKTQLTNLHKNTLEDLIVKNSWICNYYNFRIRRMKLKYERKNKKLDLDLSTAKITDKEFQSKDNNIQIDRHLNLEFLENKKKKYQNFIIKKNRIQNKINNLQNLQKREIEDLKICEKIIPPNNYFKGVKDVIATLKSIYILGFSLNSILQSISSHLRKYSMIYTLFFVVGIFFFMTGGSNLNADQFRLIIQSNAFILIIGMAMLMVIVSGYIDLSVGSLMGFLGALSVITFNRTGNLGLSIIFTMVVGGAVGMIQGILIGYLKIPSFIVTLGGMLLFKGLILWVTSSQTIIPDTEEYQQFIVGSIPDVKIGDFHLFSFLIVFACGLISALIMFISRNKKAKYGIVSNSNISFSIQIAFIIGMFSLVAYLMGYSLFGLHYYVLYIMGLAILFMFIMQNTSFGRKIYSIGGNSKAAILSGINKSRVTTYVFIITGITVAFASVVFTGIASSANPQVSGQGYELDVISSVFVGGASMSGGIGTIQGSLIGGLILGFINNGMNLLNLGIQMQYIIKAAVLISAVGYDIFSNRKIG